MFQFRRFPPYNYVFIIRSIPLPVLRFPHSEIHGSRTAFVFPWLIVDRYVLRRLPMPRHSPCALISLTFCLFCVFLSNTAKNTYIVFSFQRCGALLRSILLFFAIVLCSKISQKMRFMILCIIISVHITILWICSLELSEFLR